METPKRHKLKWVISLLAVIWLVGCQPSEPTPNDDSESNTSAATQDPRSAEEILATARNRYANARSYSDKAVLYLNYRLEGRLIQEPHPWSLAWDREGHFSADWFNAKIRGDSQRLSCYVFDIESGNIDNQQVMLRAGEEAPIERLLADSIARHFVCGASELPLDEWEVEQNNPLIHPGLGFYQEQLRREWLDQPQTLKRLANDDSTGNLCSVLEAQLDEKTYRIWIGVESGLIEQIEWPLQYLASDVLAASEISALKFFVRFHEVQLDVPLEPNRCTVKQRLGAKLVEQYIKLPPALPSQLIGETVGEFELFSPSGERVLGQSFAGTTTALMWVAGQKTAALLKEFDQLSQSPDTAGFRFGVVYSSEFLQAPGTGSHELAPRYNEMLASLGIEKYCDPQLEANARLKLRAVPCVIVLSEAGQIQFAQAIDSDDWGEQLVAAMGRVARGEDVAAEMKLEHQRFLDRYHAQLAAAHPASRQQHGANGDGLVSPRQRWREAWRVGDLREPGNIHVLPDSKRILVVDGWQTVVEIDEDGNIRNTYTPALPTNTAINRIRSVRTDDGRLWYAMFSLLGKQVFVFDHDWQPLGAYPDLKDGQQNGGISECQWGDLGADGKPELWLSFLDQRGLQRFELSTGDVDVVSMSPLKGFVKTSNHLWELNRDGTVSKGGDVHPQLEEWNISKLWRASRSSETCFAVGRHRKEERWQLFHLEGDRKIGWTADIAPQIFENNVEAIFSGSEQSNLFCGVLSKRNTIDFFDVFGRLVSSHTTNADLSGAALISKNGQANLLTSGKSGVILWKPRNLVPSLPASHPR